ncbi:hypothetical protein QO200_00115 [Flavobacterium sp. Arc3]|uniref:hypothetical protein n=1 Tax=Flavobacterium sp. Arc3 TaxID=3046686 RepID=UPI00352C7AFB
MTILSDSVGVKTTVRDKEGELQTLTQGIFMQMDKVERNYLMGLDSWGTVAEIWQQTNYENPFQRR